MLRDSLTKVCAMCSSCRLYIFIVHLVVGELFFAFVERFHWCRMLFVDYSHFEPEPTHAAMAVHIDNLTKVCI